MVRLIDIAYQNPWWKYGANFASYDRDLKDLKQVFSRKVLSLSPGKIYIIRGTRRVGKTVYVKLLIEKLLNEGVNEHSIIYISCDRLVSRFELLRVIEEFLLSRTIRPLYVFLDEITYLKDWQLALKNIAESPWIDELIIVATGSSPILLKRGGERLPGRRVEGNEFYMKPLTFREFVLNFIEKYFPYPDTLKKLKKEVLNTHIVLTKSLAPQFSQIIPFAEELTMLLNIYLITGGFPEAILQYLADGRVSEKTIELFVRLILGEITKMDKSEHIALRILRYIIDHLAQRVSIHKIAQECGVHHATVQEYLELMQETFLIHVLDSWDLSKKTPAQRKQKKIIVCDPFIHHALFVYLAGCTWEDALEIIEKRKPQLVECVVISHLVQTMEIPYVREWWSFLGYYYNKREIDVIMKIRNQLFGFEVKYEEKFTPKRYPIPVKFLTKYEFSVKDDIIPVPLFLVGLKKSERVL